MFLNTLVLALLLASGCVASSIGDRWFRKLEIAAAHLAQRKTLAIYAVGLAAILSRLALLPVLPVPLPSIHDEFSYLLAADTFAHGRLTNPTHPMWVFFDTFHVLQHPTYASKYPPASGAVLALGQLLGHPWIGSLLSVAAMCVAMTWMLQGWFPPRWALLGGVLFLLRVSLFNYYMDGYYVAAVPAIGAALALGALPRILKTARQWDAIVMGIGAAILGCSRPVEGVFFCLPVAMALVVELLSRRRFTLAVVARRMLLPAIIAPAAALLFLAYYNWRVTKDPFLFPYALYHREYFNNYPVFAWQHLTAARHYANPQFEVFFNVFHRGEFQLSWGGWVHRSWNACVAWWYVYAGPVLSIPCVMLVYVVRNHKARLFVWQFLLCAAGLLSVIWFQPHYAAPVTATWLGLLVFAMRYLRQMQCRNWKAGVALTRAVVLLAAVWVLVLAGRAARLPARGWSANRADIVKQLCGLPDKHLVIVHYSLGHNVHHEWVYNDAEIDAAKIVWAREIPGLNLAPLLAYFNGRRTWILDADRSPPRLKSYPNDPRRGSGD